MDQHDDADHCGDTANDDQHHDLGVGYHLRRTEDDFGEDPGVAAECMTELGMPPHLKGHL